MAAVSITEDNLVKTLGDFITSLVDCPVVRGQVNRVPMPTGDCVVMTPSTAAPLSTTVQTYTDVGTVHTTNLTQGRQWAVQVDCYGDGANDRATALSVALRSVFACEAFAATGLEIQPLYAGDPRQLPLITGEAQYTDRWSFDAVLQYNPTISVPQEFANALVVGLINVDATFPPGA